MASKRSKVPPKRRKPPPTDEAKPRRKLVIEQPKVQAKLPTRKGNTAGGASSGTPGNGTPVSGTQITVELGGSSQKPTVAKPAGANASCLVVCPSLSPIEPRVEERLRELERRGYTVFRAKGFSAVEQGRNQLASDALHQGFRETMWIDPDVDFEPDAVERLRGHKLPLVCGIYPQKGGRSLSCDVLPGTDRIVFGEEGGLTEVLYASCGFMLVQTSVYQLIRDKLKLPLCNTRGGQRGIWPFFQNLVKEGGRESGDGNRESEIGGRESDIGPYDRRHVAGVFLSHDYAFCERARWVGLRIVADTTIRLWHLGSYGYGWEEAGSDTERFDSYEYYVE